MNSTINLKIYGDDDEVIAEFETKRLRWGVVEDCIDLQEQLSGKSDKDKIISMRKLVQMVFPKLTDEQIRLADVNDIKLCFFQIVNMVKKIEGAEGKKE